MKTLVLSTIFLSASVALAAQTVYDLGPSPELRLVSGKAIAVSGKIGATMEDVQGGIHQLLVFGGSSSGLNCNKKVPVCLATGFDLGGDGETLIAKIEVDADQDGNIEASKTISIGSVDHDGRISLSVSSQINYVVEKYSFLEKLAGAQDRSYISGQIRLP